MKKALFSASLAILLAALLLCACNTTEPSDITSEVESAQTSQVSDGTYTSQFISRVQSGDLYIKLTVEQDGTTMVTRQAKTDKVVSTVYDYTAQAQGLVYYDLYIDGYTVILDTKNKVYNASKGDSTYMFNNYKAAGFQNPTEAGEVTRSGIKYYRESFSTAMPNSDGSTTSLSSDEYYFINGELKLLVIKDANGDIFETMVINEISDTIPDDMMMKIPEGYTPALNSEISAPAEWW